FLPNSPGAVNFGGARVDPRESLDPRPGVHRDDFSLAELNSTFAGLSYIQRNGMTALNQAQLEKFIRGIGVRQIRLVCGLVLFAYLVSHFLNHALGNVSLDALATGVYYHKQFWQFLPVAIVFYTAALVHAGLGIWALYQRRPFSWRAIEPLQLLLGLSIPTLVISHVAGIRLGHALFGIEKLYPQVFYADWVAAPFRMWM